MPASLAELLWRYRIAASLTQEALADRCGLSPALLDAVRRCRGDITYRFRFGYEKAAIDSAEAVVASWPRQGEALSWREAAALALSGGG